MLVTILFFFVCVRISNCKLCNDGSNPCKLDAPGSPNAYFLPINGYYCLDSFKNDGVICTCPDHSTTHNQPCRICDRDPNPCGVGPSVVSCNDINKSFICVCKNEREEFVHTTISCDENSVIPEIKCENDGVRDPTTNLCNCPSGFTGSKCETRDNTQLCDRIRCMSNGVCSIRPLFDGAAIYQSKCLCRSGSEGDYCERQSKIGSCTASYCLNDGICRQRQLGSSNYKSCHCKPGWAGAQCDKQYFRCRASGYFIDEFMKNQGKYFSCKLLNNGLDYLLQQRSCPKGLKFKLEKQLCLL
ncbi:unnamed protein product [Rotaria sp. Silwood1]|nr:unnamed protein product [Rotaria sp. Silwood1]CAF1687836.1 unnamed protein product [Rotaria sp. Silwood1]CAF3845236.1 unnamed protein product [Rotaria sp. Silwood1]CAF3893546.1 unnamed protein product [Rotaria sp. Silwood1]CAF3937063.1 unnamed protein product [Rotaria sp. Silwood1]